MEKLSRQVVLEISRRKQEPEWMRKLRLEAREQFLRMEWPDWGPDLEELKQAKLEYYIKPRREMVENWGKVPKEVREIFEKLGVPEVEREALAGVGAQFDSEMVYRNLKERQRQQGIIYMGMEEAVRSEREVKYQGQRRKIKELVQEYFMSLVRPEDHKIAALHAAVWSGGSFVLVPKGVRAELPIQSYFRFNAPGAGQFEHTLVLVDEAAELHFIEGCSAPRYNVANLHAGGMEFYVGKNSKLKFSMVESWSKNMFNLNTKKVYVETGGLMEWVAGSFGSKVSMVYPATILAGEGARVDYKGVSMAGEGQNFDTGAKVIHLEKNTYSNLEMKSVVRGGGRVVSRSLVKIGKNAEGARSFVDCQALVLDEDSRAESVPKVIVNNKRAEVGYEASVGKIDDKTIEYLRSRGLDERRARSLTVKGFAGGVASEMPLEYAGEMNKMIELEVVR